MLYVYVPFVALIFNAPNVQMACNDNLSNFELMYRGISSSSNVLCYQFLSLCYTKIYSAAKVISDVVISRGNRRFPLTNLLAQIWGVTVFRENRISVSSQAVAGVCSTVHVKFILGVGPKVNESIEDLVVKCSRWASC